MEDPDAVTFKTAVSHFGRQKLIADAFSSKGFGSTLDQIKRQADKRIANFRTSGQTTRPMLPIIFDYIDAPSLDAFACTYIEHHIIALSASGAAVLQHTMFRLLSRPDVLEEIGNPTAERTDLPFTPLTVSFLKLVDSYHHSGTKMSDYVPRNRIRELTARVMSQLAIDFVIAHEFRHVQAGHIEYWKALLGRGLISELNSHIEQQFVSMVSQALEMDADCYAIKTVLQSALRIAENPTEFSEGWGLAMPTAQRAAFLSIMSAYLVFKLFDLAGEPSLPWAKRTHPSPDMRNSMLMATVIECFKRWNRPELHEWYLGSIPRFIEVGERQVGDVTNVSPDRSNLLRVNGPDGEAHVSEILKTWSSIEEDLSRFTYVSF